MSLPIRETIPRKHLTAEIFSIPLEGQRFLVYAPLRQVAFIATASTVNLITDLQAGKSIGDDENHDQLFQFLDRLNLIDCVDEEKPITSRSGAPNPTAVTLFLTTACNLKCGYCYASAGDRPSENMLPEVAMRGIDFVIANALKAGTSHFGVNFHGGGEPTVNWKTLTFATEYARRRATEEGLGVGISTATNGVLSEERTQWICENLDGASVSFDGLAESQDRNRPMLSGQGSTYRVLRTLGRFDRAGFAYGLRMTVTTDDVPRLPDAVRFICESCGVRRIQAEPVYALGRGKDSESAENDGFISAFREAKTIAKSYGRDLYFSGARLGTLTNHFCGVSQDAFSLSPRGGVSACYEVFSEQSNHADVFFYGAPSENGVGYTFNLDRLEKLRGLSVDHREYCQGCFAKWHCAGDCYHKSLAANPDGEFAGSARCDVIRELTKAQILDSIRDAGGAIWLGDSGSPA